MNFKNAIWTLEERYAIKFCFKLGIIATRWKLDLLLWARDQETEFPVEACWLSQTQEGQTEQILPQTFDDPFFDSTGLIYMHRVPTGQTVNKKYYVEVLREFREIFLGKRPVLFKSAKWHFHQDNTLVQNTSPQLKAGSLWGMMRGVGGVRKSIHQSWLAKGLGLRLLCWGFKGVQEEIPREEASTIQIRSVAFPAGQCASP